MSEGYARRTGRLVLLGDSIAAGLGARGNSFGSVVAQQLGLELVDRSITGGTIRDTFESLSASPADADVYLVAHGVTEPLIRPSQRSLRFFPARWHNRGWMDPRPCYSSRPARRLLEQIESAVRWRVRNALLACGCGEQLMPIEEFVSTAGQLVSVLSSHGARIVFVEPPPIDERFFPGTARQQRLYWERLTREVPVEVVHVGAELRRWEDFLLDRFHPNESGHARIAALIVASITSAGR